MIMEYRFCILGILGDVSSKLRSHIEDTSDRDFLSLYRMDRILSDVREQERQEEQLLQSHFGLDHVPSQLFAAPMSDFLLGRSYHPWARD